MGDTQHDILDQLHPKIRKFILFMWQEEKLHPSSKNIQILKPSSTMKKCEGDKVYANNFIVSIPYAGQHIEWGVKFCNDDMTFAPDFNFKDNSFIGELTASAVAEKLPSWKNWDSNNPSALYNILMELLILYRNNEIRKLEAERFSRLHSQFIALMGGTSLRDTDVEVSVDPSGIVRFLIVLKVDFAQLPKDIFKNFILGPRVTLMVTFPRPNGVNVQPQIFFTPPIDQNLLDIENKQIPPLPSSGCLMDYVPAVQKFLQDKIQHIVENYTLKRKYIVHLLTIYTVNVIEYDHSNYSKVTLLFESGSFHWLLMIVISNNFPKEKPKWTLRSVYHMSSDEPVTETLLDYPYSPRWRYDEMIKRALKYTGEKIPHFQIKKK